MTWRIYSLLTRVEVAFRAMKNPLAERRRTHGDVMLRQILGIAGSR